MNTNGNGAERNPPRYEEPIPYHEFRLSLSFSDVRREYAQEQIAALIQGNPFTVSRKMVLRRMCRYKHEEYEHYLRQFDETEGVS
jgi:hypothetical protein